MVEKDDDYPRGNISNILTTVVDIAEVMDPTYVTTKIIATIEREDSSE